MGNVSVVMAGTAAITPPASTHYTIIGDARPGMHTPMHMYTRTHVLTGAHAPMHAHTHVLHGWEVTIMPY